jgi:hypothetical protein
MGTPIKVTIAPATWMGRSDRFYLIVTYSDGTVRHECRAVSLPLAMLRARGMMLPPVLEVTREVAA